MKNITLLFILSSVLLVSCNSVYNEQKEDAFTDLIWQPTDIISFDPNIEDATANYDLHLTISHYRQMGVKEFPVALKITWPNGEEIAKTYDLIFTDENGKTLTDCGGDYCDLEQIIESDFKFNQTGKYKIEVLPVPGSPSINGVLSLRLKVIKK